MLGYRGFREILGSFASWWDVSIHLHMKVSLTRWRIGESLVHIDLSTLHESSLS